MDEWKIFYVTELKSVLNFILKYIINIFILLILFILTNFGECHKNIYIIGIVSHKLNLYQTSIW